MPERETEKYLTYAEFAGDRKISKSTVKNLIRDGKLTPTYITEGSPRISFTEARRYDDARKAGA